MKNFAWALFILLFVSISAFGCDDDSSDGFDSESTGDASSLEDAQASLPVVSGEISRSSIYKLRDWIDNLSIRADRADGDYEFTPEEMHEIANLGVGLPPDEAWKVIHAELMRRHPGKIKEVPRWTFNSAGTAFCELALVYASLNEYVAFFGTPIGADGFSGRYNKADVWDLMVDGEMWNYSPGEFQPVISLAGDMAFLPRGTGKGVKYVDHAWMIDYARGNIPSMFMFGVIAPSLFVTLDYQSAWEQIVDFAGLLFQNWF